MPTHERKKLPRKKVKHHEGGTAHHPDFMLLLLVTGLTIFGLLMIYNVSAFEGFYEFGDKLYFVKQQLTWIGIGSIAGFLAYKINYYSLKRISPLFLGIAIILLIAVLIPGIGTRILGAKRWINLSQFFPFLPGVTIQPAELVKPAIILYLATWLTSQKAKLESQRFTTFVAILGLLVGLIMLEPDLGTTIVVTSIASGLYFVSGAPIKQFLLLVPAGILGIITLIVFEPYRMQRLVSFLNPQSDPQGAAYHINQILITLGSGGFGGVGLGNSGQKYGYLPEATTDSIFAVIAGELGFLGAIALVGIFVWLFLRGVTISSKSQDKYSQYLALGIIIWIGMQTIVNMGSMVALFPLTGVPLPFVSYGGSSLVTLLFAIGLLLNISKYTRE